MDSALLVTGGLAPDFSVLSSRMADFNFVCAADSGLDTLRAWGVRPDLVLGDFDSLRDPAVLAEYEGVVRHPTDKDDTDTELGLKELRARGYGRVTMAGGGGGRLDHLFALRALFELPWGPDAWYAPGELVIRIREPLELDLIAGGLISAFPTARGASGMKSEGLRWLLDGLRWGPGEFGISNRAIGGRAIIAPGDGELLVVVPYESLATPYTE
jgi:thiamine pyrophosphokinase